MLLELPRFLKLLLVLLQLLVFLELLRFLHLLVILEFLELLRLLVVPAFLFLLQSMGFYLTRAPSAYPEVAACKSPP